MEVLRRIVGMTLRYRKRLVLAYFSFFAAIVFSLLVVHLLGEAIGRVVVRADDGSLMLGDVERGDPVLLRPGPPGRQPHAGDIRLWPHLHHGLPVPEGLLRPAELHVRQAPAPELRLPRQGAHGEPDVQGHLGHRGGEAVRHDGDGPLPGGGGQGRRHRRAAGLPELGADPEGPGLRALPGGQVDGGHDPPQGYVAPRPGDHGRAGHGHAGEPVGHTRGQGVRRRGAREGEVPAQGPGPPGRVLRVGEAAGDQRGVDDLLLHPGAGPDYLVWGLGGGPGRPGAR